MTQFPQQAFHESRAGSATFDQRDRNFIRDSPYLVSASRSQDLSAEDDATMPDYDMPIEEQIKVLVKEFRTFRESVATRFDSMDTRFDSMETRFDSMDTRFDSMETRLDSMDTRFDSMETRLDSVETRLDSMDTRLDSMDTRLDSIDTKLTRVDGKVEKVQVLLQDTHAIAKLGLEGLDGLRESTDDKFAAAAKTNAEQIGLLKSVVVHVRKPVGRAEQPKRRGRS